MHPTDGPSPAIREAAERLGVAPDAVAEHLLAATGGPDAPAADVLRELDERIAVEEVRPRLTDDLLAEHEANPIGRHGDDLQRVLHYLRRRPLSGKLVVVETRPNERWCLARLSGERGVPPTLIGECYDDPAAAEHAAFRERVAAFRERFGAAGDDA